jgi:acyl carrier protein
LLAVEEEFWIVVKDEDIRPENLKSLSCLTRFVEGKLS